VTWRSWTSDLTDLLLPTGCVVCRDWIPSGQEHRIVCVRCSTRLRAPSWPRCARCHYPRGTGRLEAQDCLECREWPAELSAARYAYRLEGPAADLVHALKYEGWREASRFMSQSMVAVLREGAGGGAIGTLPEPSVVVPVPTTRSRERERGYNQAGLLAAGIAESTGSPLCPVLVRARTKRSQTSLSPDERRENVRGAFGLSDRGRTVLPGTRVILVDDVLTTGATAGEAARVLAAGGADSVTLLAFARALPGRATESPKQAAYALSSGAEHVLLSTKDREIEQPWRSA